LFDDSVSALSPDAVVGEDPCVSRVLEIETLDLGAGDCRVGADMDRQLVLVWHSFDCEHGACEVEFESRGSELGPGFLTAMRSDDLIKEGNAEKVILCRMVRVAC
jgi:hypothetical protein